MVVTVLDSNDQSPIFLANSYSGFVVENSNIGNIILAVEAEDMDEVMFILVTMMMVIVVIVICLFTFWF